MEIFMRREEVERVTGLRRSSIYYLMSHGQFPKPVKLGRAHAVAWLQSEVKSWQESRVAERGGSPSTDASDAA